MEFEFELEGLGRQLLKRVSFDKKEKVFSLYVGNPDKKEYVFYIAYGYIEFDDPLHNGLVELFTHPCHPENDVRRLTIKTETDVKTVGWLCTIGALISDQHEYFDDPNFRRAAFTAIQVLLNDCRFTKSPAINHESELNLSDFFDEELSVIVLYKPSVNNIISSDFNEIIPCLHQNSFMPYNGKHQYSIEPNHVALAKFNETTKNLRLTSISSDAKHQDFITQVFRNLLLSAQTPLLRFFIYYQLIESLSSIICSDRQSRTIEEMQLVKHSPLELHPLLKKLHEDANEQKRINLLFNEYSGIDHNLFDLKTECNKFLIECKLDEEDTTSKALYKARNVIFHDLRRVPENSASTLKSIVELLGYAVPELLINFKIPA